MTRSQRSIALTALMTLLVVGLVKFLLVRSLLGMGVARELLQAQDAIITGALAGALAWVFLIAERVRHRQEEEQLRAVADLNHHLRNALEIIFASAYLRDSDKAAAILASVERIDNTLKILLTQTPAAGASRWNVPRRSRPEERRKMARTHIQQQVTIRFTRHGNLEVSGTAKNVSANGIFVHLNADVVVDTEVELVLTPPTEAGDLSMPIHGKVVRIERAAVGREPRATVRTGIALQLEGASGADLGTGLSQR